MTLRRSGLVDVLVVAGGTIVSAFLSAGLVTAIGNRSLGSSETASWVQAVGSIAAIAGAFMVAHRQSQHDRKLEQERRNEERAWRFRIVNAILLRTSAGLESIKRSRDENTFAYAIPEHVQLLRDCGPILASLPPFDMPSGNLLLVCHQIQRQIPEVCGLLDDERTALFELRPPRETPDEVSRAMRDLKTNIDLGMHITKAKFDSAG